jgi:hypothetical protein
MRTNQLFRLLMLAIALPLSGAEPVPRALEFTALSIFPESIELYGQQSRQRLGVLGEAADGRRKDLTAEAQMRSSDPAVVTIEAQGVLRPAGDGEAVVTIRVGGLAAKARIRVRGMTGNAPVSFSREIEPILTRSGCNGGGCHGAQQGKGGFRLSLFGFDPAFDYRRIVQSAKGRRVVLPEPERSLLLLKPSLQMRHGGGERLPRVPLATTRCAAGWKTARRLRAKMTRRSNICRSGLWSEKCSRRSSSSLSSGQCGPMGGLRTSRP